MVGLVAPMLTPVTLCAARYASQEAIDNDDGSAYYNTHGNFFAYAGNGLKCAALGLLFAFAMRR